MERNQTTKKMAFNPLVLFSLIIFFITLSDGLMSYISPVILNIHLADPFMVGLILATSSFFGIFFNFYIAENLGHKNFIFYIKWMILFSFMFPLAFIFLPRQILFFITAMIIWSVYYDFRNYSKYGLVDKFFNKEKHTYAWSIINSFQSAAYMIGPALAVFLLKIKIEYVLYAAALSSIFAFFVYKPAQKRFTKKHQSNPEHIFKKTILKEIKILEILSKKIWPLILFYFSMVFLDACFWSTGVLFAEKLRSTHTLGGLFLVIYCIPPIFMGLLASKIILPIGKKRTSFITGVISALFLGTIGFSKNIYMILASTFFASSFASITLILLSAVFEDYVDRARDFGTDIISLNQASTNLAYIIGPILLGFTAKMINFPATFKLSSVLILITALIAFLVVPRKIKLPQKEITLELNKK